MRIASIFILLLTLGSCSNTAISEDFVPQCVEARLNASKVNICPSAHINIDEYSYNEEIVYLFDEGSCSKTTYPILLDAQCQVILIFDETPDNIIMGQRFHSQAVHIRNIFNR